MSTPTPRTDAATALTSQHRHDDLFGDPEFGWVTAGFARELERELATERETSRLLRVSMDARCEGYTQSRRRMSAPTPRTDRQAVVLLGKTWIASYDEMHEHARKLERELAAEREKVRTLRDACDQICDEWGGNHETNPIGAGQRMSTRAGKALEATEGAP